MKQKFLKRNNPRIARAIREAVLIVGHRSGYFGNYYYHSDVGRMVYELGLKADKFDVLNKLRMGFKKDIVTYVRGDIRHRKRYPSIITIIVLLILCSMQIILAK